MKHAFKKFMALLLAVVMILGILPAAFAADANVGSFTDVKESDWFAPYVKFVYEHDPQLMNGVTPTTFGPEGTCTRAMAVTVLYRLADPVIPSVKPSTFTDLKGDWYKNAVAWGQKTGVVKGVTETTFDPEGLVTREQLVTMVWRFYGMPIVEGDNLKSFPDAANVSAYARDAFNWAISKGIIGGSDGKLLPQGNATRAEMAKIIAVFVQKTAPCTKHVWDEGKVTKEPTCTEKGEKLYTCTVCGETKTEEIPAKGHTYVDGKCVDCDDMLASNDEIVIYYTNDVHTYVDKALSYDNIADLKAQTAKVAAGVLLLDAGDHIQGTAYGALDQGKKIIEMMSAAGYDAATLGNHEFDYGMQRALEITKQGGFPYLSANFRKVDGTRVLDAYKIFTVGGKKIAVIGITTPESITKSTPAYFMDETQTNWLYAINGDTLYEDVQAAIDAAKAENPDYIIALGHLGDDPSSAPWRSEDVISRTTGLDAFIDGHSHSTVPMKELKDKEGNTVVLTQTGSYFDAIGKMTIKGDKISTELITCFSGSDATVAAIKNELIAAVDKQLGEKIGTNEVDLTVNGADGKRAVRSAETNLGDFTADALRYYFNVTEGLHADVAIMNGGGIRANLPAGDVTYKTCKTVHTFGNVACLMEVTGQQILDALEWGAKDVGAGENGGFLQVSGITYEIHSYIKSTVQQKDKIWTGAPTGEYRVKNVKIGGEDLDLTKTYTMAGYNYTIRNMGDGFAMFKDAKLVKDYVQEDYLVLANYVKSFPDATIKADNSPLGANYAAITGEGRIKIVSEKPDVPTPPTPVPGNVYTKTDMLKEGDEVIIVCEAKNIALGADYGTSYYNPGVAVTPTDGKITTDNKTIVWTVGKEGDFYTFSYDGKKIGMGTEYTSMTLGGVNYKWQVEAAATAGSFYVKNLDRDPAKAYYMQWYADKTYWSGYHTLNEELMALSFYVKGDDTPTPPTPPTPPEPTPDPDPSGDKVFEKVTADLGTWSGTYVIGYDLGDGNAVIFNGQSIDNGNGVTVAIADNKVTVSTDCAIEIAAVDGGYTVKAKGGYLNGKAADQNGMKFEEAPSTATIVWTDGNPILTSAVGTILRYNNGPEYNDQTKNYSWFRFYKANSSVQTPVAFFKLTGETPVVCAHEWNDGVITTPATCTADGVKTYTCTKCGATKTEAVPATGHNYVDGVCTVCGAKENVSSGDVYALATELKDGDEVIVVNVEAGKAMSEDAVATKYRAGVDVVPENDKITTSDSKIVWDVVKTDDGYKFMNDAGETLSATSGLSFADTDNVWMLTAGTVTDTFIISSTTAKGTSGDPKSIEWFATYKEFTTFYKNDSNESLFAMKLYVKESGGETPVVCAHEWNDGVVTTPATCTAGGVKTYTCTKCGATKTEAVPAAGHNYVDGVCTVCGATEPATGSGYTKVTTAPTDWSGTYLIVFEKTETTAYAFNGLDKSGNFVETTFTDNTIAASEALTACEVLVEKTETGYTFKLTGGTNSGKYLTALAGSNKIVFSSTAKALSVAMENNTVVIKDGEAPFQFNNGTTNGQWFRFFGKKNGGQSAIALYKLG